MLTFQFLYTYGGSDVDITGSGRNVTGAPIVYNGYLGALAVGKLSGEGYQILNPIAGIYRFTIEGAGTVSCRRVHAWDRDNPQIFSGARAVFTGNDVQYWNANLLPGWIVGLKSDMQVGDEFEIGVGCYWDATAGRWQRILSFGPGVAGFQGTARELKIKNNSAGTSLAATYVSTSQFTLLGDKTAYLPASAEIEAHQGIDGTTTVTIVSSLYSSVTGLTTCSILETTLTVNLEAVVVKTLTSCVLVATNAIRAENDPTLISEPDPGFPERGIRPFDQFYQSGILNPEADTDLNGAAVTFANYAVGSPPTVDILIDGEPIDVYNTVAEELIPGGTGLNCDGNYEAGTVYRFADGTKYQSGTFVLSSSLQETDTATIFVSDGGESVWLADVTGVFTRGSIGIPLTKSGQEAGTVTASGEVSCNISIRPPAVGTSDLNARSFSLRAVGIDANGVVLSDEHQGSFLIARGDGLLSVRVNATAAAYDRPRYTEDGEPDDEGDYVEDLTAPGTYILRTGAPNGGQYGSVWDYLKDNGVIVEGV